MYKTSFMKSDGYYKTNLDILETYDYYIYYLKYMYKFFNKDNSPFVTKSKLNTMSNKRSVCELVLAAKTKTVLPLPLFLLFFGFTLFFMPVDLFGGGSSALENVPGQGDSIIPVLKETLHEVDLLRRCAMHHYKEAIEVASFNEVILRNNTNNIKDFFPGVTQQYAEVLESFKLFLNNNRELATSKFQDYIEPLDTISGRLEEILKAIDPTFIEGPDTDDEDIEYA
jgi:hypothetical protein